MALCERTRLPGLEDRGSHWRQHWRGNEPHSGVDWESLKEAGCTLDDVVKCTYYLARIEDFDEFNQAYAKVFTGTLPARTTVQAVLSRRLKVEIDANARIPSQPESACDS
jgi:hypothetical protein